MKIMKNLRNVLYMIPIVVLLQGFTGLTQQTPPPKGVPKRSEDKNAGIVIPGLDAQPFDVIQKSYDPLVAFMRNSEKGTFMSLSSSNFDFNPHKLTFYHKKYGFVAYKAYRVDIAFTNEIPQQVQNFSFAPFEITSPKVKSDLIPIAEYWVKFFDSLGWKRAKEDSYFQYYALPYCEKDTYLCTDTVSYMEWENDGLQLAISISTDNVFDKNGDIPKYSILYVKSSLVS